MFGGRETYVVTLTRVLDCVLKVGRQFVACATHIMCRGFADEYDSIEVPHSSAPDRPY